MLIFNDLSFFQKTAFDFIEIKNSKTNSDFILCKDNTKLAVVSDDSLFFSEKLSDDSIG